MFLSPYLCSMKWIAFLFIFITKATYAQTDRDSLTHQLIATAKSQLGVPYKYATSNPNESFDCSGFTSYVYGTFELPHSRSSKDYGQLGEQVTLETCLPGDCILFSGTAPGSKTIGHVGIVISNDENGIQFIHCSSSKNHFGVVITNYHDSNYPKRFLQVRRLF